MTNKSYIVALVYEDGDFVSSDDPHCFDTWDEAEEHAANEIQFLDQARDDGTRIEILEVSKRYKYDYPPTSKKIWQEVK